MGTGEKWCVEHTLAGVGVDRAALQRGQRKLGGNNNAVPAVSTTIANRDSGVKTTLNAGPP